jgi:hypothetical protein
MSEPLAKSLQDFLKYSQDLNLQPTTIKNKHNGLLRLLAFLKDRPLSKTLRSAMPARRQFHRLNSYKNKTP